MNRSLLLLFFCLMSFSLKAQDYPMLHFTTEDGLPSNNVYSIYRDSKGFLWFATDKGIARYNGLKFETFTTFDGLPDNEIFLFKEDYEGRLWMATYNGALCYYKDGVFHTAANTPFLRLPFISPQIFNITVEKDSSITFNFYNTFIELNIKHETRNIYDFSKNQFVRDSFDKKNIFWIVYKRKISPDKYQIIHQNGVLIIDTFCHLVHSEIRHFSDRLKYIQSQNNGFLINNKVVLSDNLDTIIVFKKYVHANGIFSFYSDGINFYLATSKGLIINDDQIILKNHAVSSFTRDNAQNCWLGTLDNGVYYLGKNFLHQLVTDSLYTGKIKYATSISNSLYYVNSDDNLYCSDNKNSKILYNNFLTAGDHTKDGAYLIDSKKRCFYYINAKGILVHYWDFKKSYLKKYAGSTDIYGVKDVFKVKNYIYIKGRNNVSRINFNDLQNNVNNCIKYDFLCDSIVQRIFGMDIDRDSILWYSTISALYKFDAGKFVIQPQFQNIAFKFFIFFKQFIVGYTHDNQLLIIDYLKKKINIDTVLSQNCIWDKVYILDSTHILVTTNNAYRLLALNSNNKFSISTIENSFIPRQAEAIAIDSTNCYFFKKGSLTIIPKMTIIDVPPIPRLFFNVLKTTRNSYHISNDMEIPYDEARNLSVSFSRLVINGQQIIQQYSFSKNDSDNWKDIKGDEINLVNPNFGTYVVMVRARSLSTGYCEPIVFRLHILKPYWATWWFISIIGMLVVAIIVFMIRYRIAYLLRKNQRAHETEMKFIRSEYKALNALMNPHFIFNTLNNVQGLVNRNDKLAANEYLRVFADIIRQNMHNVSKETIPLQKEVELVVNYLLLEKLRFKELLNYSINIDERLDLSEIMVPPLLIQPLVENSIKHGILPLESVEGKVVINIYERGNVLYIEVRDNGIGMTKSQERSKNALHESFGMENIKKRMEQLSIIQNKIIKMDISEIKDRDGNLEWTMVSISMHLG